MKKEEIENLVNTDFDKFQLVINRIYKEEYVKQLEKENQELKDNWNKLKEIIKKKFVAQGGFTSYEWNDLLNELLDKMQEIELKGDKEC